MNEDITRDEMRDLVDARKKANDERYKNRSKSNLTRHVETKLKTTMIGALAKFEENFGSLWGHNSDNPTDKQKQLRELWNLTRTEILNNGNNQLRAAREEINCYTIQYNKFETKFIIRDSKELIEDDQE